MRVLGFAVAATLLTSAALAEDTPAPVNVRMSSDGRVWQVALQPTEPIVWRWPDWATAAQLTATSYVGKVVTSLTVTRGEGEAFGSWTFPSAMNDFDESIHDVTLELKKGEKVYETRTARFVVLPGVKGGAIDVLQATDEKVTQVGKSVRLLPYSADWAGSDAATLTLSTGAEEKNLPLLGTSGWHPFLTKTAFSGLAAKGGDFTLTLGFGETATPLSADLNWQIPGMLLFLR